MKAVLLDLGGTLVGYYDRAQFPAVLAESMSACRTLMAGRGLSAVDEIAMQAAAAVEGKESPDRKVRPMEDRLARIFLPNDADPALPSALSLAFLGPIFSRARRFVDALPALAMLRDRGLRLAIVSNMPWGSPRMPWEAELVRQGLDEFVTPDRFITCRDAGFRKPHGSVFALAARAVGCDPAECLFVGDEPVWDYDGATAAGMRPVWIDRGGVTWAEIATPPEVRIRSLLEIDQLI